MRRLQYFVEFAHHGGVDAGHDWESMRNHVAALEKELGFELVHKKGPQARRLTAAGQHYVRDAQRILRTHQDMLAEAARRNLGVAGRLRIGLCEEACTLYFARALTRFSQRFPEVALDVVEGDSVDLARAVRRRDVDLALTLPLSANEGLAVRDAWLDRWSVALSPGHPLEARTLITCQDLAHEPLVLADPLLPSHGHEYIREAFHHHQIEPCIGALGINRTTMLVLAVAGAGSTFVPQAMVRVPATGSGLVRLEFRPLDVPLLRICVAVALNSPPRTALQFMQVIDAADEAVIS
nr:LysR substrate-binding domain-containing protein [Variovorax terrae]